ncbi:DUF445 domain-containing protein [Chitinophaga lutea]
MWLYLIPFLGAFTGWFVLRMAWRLLFYRIFPARRQQIGEQLGKVVSEKFFSFDRIKAQLTDPAKITAIKPVVEEHLEHFLRHKLPEAMPMIAMFIGDSTINQIKTTLANELDLLFPKLISQYLDKAQSDLDVPALISRKVSEVSGETLERELRARLGNGWAKAGWAAAGVGFLIGLLQLGLALL